MSQHSFAAPKWFSALLLSELAPWLTLLQEQIDGLYTHYELLLKWNARMNLTSMEPGEEMVRRHYCESLFLAAHLPAVAGATIIDVGSGPGFPGIPMAIARPDWMLALLESNQRKAVFLKESTRGLRNAATIARRVEDVQDRFDWIVSRAVEPSLVLEQVPRIAAQVALLTGEAKFPVSDIAWDEPVKLPWGDRRTLRIGRFHVERS